MSQLITTFQGFDETFIRTLGIKATPSLTLEDIQAGSIKTWLRTSLESIDDSDLKKLNWKRVVGTFLVQAKHGLLSFLKDNPSIESAGQLLALENRIKALADSTQIRHIPLYLPPSRTQLLSNIVRLRRAVTYLAVDDHANFIFEETEIEIEKHVEISEKAMEEVFAKEDISESELVVRVKKPDFLGTSKWDLKFAEHTVQAKILDAAWLDQFQKQQITVRPGDSLRVRLRTAVRYDQVGGVVSTNHEVFEVKEVLPKPSMDQAELSFRTNKEGDFE